MNKLIAIFVALAIMLGCLFCPALALETDTDNEEINKAIKLLAALDVLTDYNDRVFKADTLITRGESAAIIVRILAGNELATATESEGFSDVPNDWRTGYIALADRLGIMNGYDNNEYGIEEPVTYNQAVKMIVTALGYSYFAQNSGGYPYGYITQAGKLGFTNGIKSSGEAELSRGDFIRMIYKSLTINICEQESFGLDSRHTVRQGRNLLNEKLKVIKAYGVVYANHMTSLFDPAKPTSSAENIMIDEEIFKIGETGSDKYLGYRVEYYYKENLQDEKVLLYVVPAVNVRETIISGDDISKSLTTKNELVFLKGDLERRLKISSGANVLYNGKPEPLYTAQDLAPETGNVKLIDNDDDGRYDTVMIESYETYMAESVSDITNRINFMYPNGKKPDSLAGIPLTDDDTVLEVYNNAGIIKYTGIKKYDVLSISRSRNTSGKKYIKILLSTEQVDGTLMATSEDKYSDIYTVNNTEYRANKYYAELISEAAALGRMYTYYIDIFGKIAFIDKSVIRSDESSQKYGYFLGITEPDLDGVSKVKLFDSTGEMKIIDTASKINFDHEGAGADSLPTERVYDRLTDAGGDPIFQLIEYGTNPNGHINEIKTAFNINADLDNVDKNKFTVSGSTYTPNLRFMDNIHFGLKYFIGADTVVMIIPPDSDLENDKAFAIGGNLLKAQEYYAVLAYNLDELSVAGVIVVQASASASPGSMDNMYIVEKISDIADADGILRKRLYLNSNGGKLSYDVAEALLDTPQKLEEFNKIGRGDAIQIVTNSRSEVSAFKLKFDVSTWTADTDNSMDDYYTINGGVIIVGTGTVKAADGNFVRFTLDNTNQDTVTGYFISYTRYYHVKNNGGEVTVRTIRKTDLTAGMKIMFFRFYHSIREIVVYEGF